MDRPVVIVGGGLAGLACATGLERAGIPWLILERADRVGGRLRTDLVEGMRLDRGFQVLFEAYPHVQDVLDLGSLDPRPFRPGAMLMGSGRPDVIDRSRPLTTLRASAFGLLDKLRSLRLNAQVGRMTLDEMWRMSDTTAEEDLHRQGFTKAFLERFARPFFGGVFLDRSLQVSRRNFRFVFKMLAAGRVVLPSSGIQAIPDRMVDSLRGGRIRTFAEVSAVTATEVTLATHERIEASAVVLATDLPVTASLLGWPAPTTGVGTVCLYFTTPEPLVSEPYLLLDADGTGPVNHAAVITSVAPEIAPGRHLLSANLVGDFPEPIDVLANRARTQLAGWFPDSDVAAWSFVRGYRVPYAQTPQPPDFREARHPRQVNGIDLAGEFLTNSSIDGALESGLDAARRVAWRLSR